IATPEKTDPITTVVALEFASPPEIDLSAAAVHADADGSITLKASDAVINGRKAKLTDDYVGSWSDQRDAILWDFRPKSAGTYNVELTYACDASNAGSSVAVNV